MMDTRASQSVGKTPADAATQSKAKSTDAQKMRQDIPKDKATAIKPKQRPAAQRKNQQVAAGKKTAIKLAQGKPTKGALPAVRAATGETPAPGAVDKQARLRQALETARGSLKMDEIENAIEQLAELDRASEMSTELQRVTALLPEFDGAVIKAIQRQAVRGGIDKPSVGLVIRAALQALLRVGPDERVKMMRSLNVPKIGRPVTKKQNVA